MKARMRIVMEGADGIMPSQSHSQRIGNLLYRQGAKLFYHYFIYHSLSHYNS